MKLIFRNALEHEKEQIYLLYKSVINTSFCVWNENYPTMFEIEEDYKTNNLFILLLDNNIIGAISIVPKNELDKCACWQYKDKNCNEIARVVIDIKYQHQGLALKLVENVEDILLKRGCEIIHLSVEKNNIPAYKTYLKAGFKNVGFSMMYKSEYYLMEKYIKKE